MTKPDELSDSDLFKLAPSPSIKKFGKDIVLAAKGHPIVDIACGGGRNSAWISYLGGRVIGVDVDLQRIKVEQSNPRHIAFANSFRRIELLELDLIRGLWPYSPGSVGGIINIHFLHTPLLSVFPESLVSGGLLVLETVEGRGENYRQLPKEGLLRKALEDSFSFLVYEERKVGPAGFDSATVRLVAKKR